MEDLQPVTDQTPAYVIGRILRGVIDVSYREGQLHQITSDTLDDFYSLTPVTTMLTGIALDGVEFAA